MAEALPFVGPVLGAVGSLVGGGGGSGSQTTTQTAQPWSGLQPYLTQLFANAQNWYNQSAPQYYSGPTFAPAPDVTRQTLQTGFNTGLSNLQQNSQARVTNSNIANGGMLGSNPFLDNMYAAGTGAMTDQFKNATAPAIASQFSAAGRFGSGAQQQALGQAETALGRGLSSFGSNLYGNAYNNDANRQLAALGMQPQLAAGAYGDLNNMMGIGNFIQSQDQAALNDAQNRFNLPIQQKLGYLQSLSNILQGYQKSGGSSSTTVGAPQQNPFASAIGGALAGNSLQQSGGLDWLTNMFGGSNLAATGGSALGGLGGSMGQGGDYGLGQLFG